MKKKTINIRISAVIMLLLAIGIGYLVYKGAKYREDITKLNTSIEIKDWAITRYKALVNDLEVNVTETEALLLESDRALRKSRAYSARMEALNLRRVNAIADLELRVAVLHDSLQVESGVPMVGVPSVVYPPPGEDDDNPGPPVIELPISFGAEDEWSLARAEVDVNTMGSIYFELKNPTLDLTIGHRGILQKEYVAAVSSKNPHLNIQKQNVIIVEKRSPTPYLVGGALGLGFVAGLLIGR